MVYIFKKQQEKSCYPTDRHKNPDLRIIPPVQERIPSKRHSNLWGQSGELVSRIGICGSNKRSTRDNREIKNRRMATRVHDTCVDTQQKQCNYWYFLQGMNSRIMWCCIFKRVIWPQRKIRIRKDIVIEEKELVLDILLPRYVFQEGHMVHHQSCQIEYNILAHQESFAARLTQLKTCAGAILLFSMSRIIWFQENPHSFRGNSQEN